MDFHQFVEHMRQEIREEGFISTFSLAGRIVSRMNEHGLIDVMNASAVLEELDQCNDIHREYYMTSKTKVGRALFFHNPERNPTSE